MTTVVKARQKGKGGYKNVGRPTVFGNPFTVDEYGREKAVELYREYLTARCKADAEFRTKVLSLRGERLGCTCKQIHLDAGLCHAVVLAQFIDAA